MEQEQTGNAWGFGQRSGGADSDFGSWAGEHKFPSLIESKGFGKRVGNEARSRSAVKLLPEHAARVQWSYSALSKHRLVLSSFISAASGV